MTTAELEEIERHSSAVAEDVKSELKLPIEALGGKIDLLDAKLDRRMTALEQRMDHGLISLHLM